MFQLTYIGKRNEHLLGASFLFSLPSGEKLQLVFSRERERENKCSHFRNLGPLNNSDSEGFVLRCQLWPVSSHHQQVS